VRQLDRFSGRSRAPFKGWPKCACGCAEAMCRPADEQKEASWADRLGHALRERLLADVDARHLREHA